MIERNKGDTEETQDSILIKRPQAVRFKESILRILQGIELNESDTVQQQDVKNVYQLLECIFKNENT